MAIRKTKSTKQSSKKPISEKTNVSTSQLRKTVDKENMEDFQVNPTKKPFISRKKAIYIGAILAVLTLLFLGYRVFVFAWVDGTPLTKFEVYKKLENKYGKDIKEQMISEALVLGEARKKGVTVSPQEVDDQVKKIADQQGGEDKLNQILSFQNMTKDELKQQLKLQLFIEKTFGQGVSVSDQEIKDYFEKNKDQLPQADEGSSESAKLKQDVTDLLRRQKIGKTFNDWLKDTLQSSRVKRFN